jgi:hypothetical protein
MKLLDLDPKWLLKAGARVGFTFLSPIGRQGNTHWRQSCFVVTLPSGEQHDLFEQVHGEDFAVQACRPDFAWTIAGGIEAATFESITVTPSIDGSAGGLWHGFITAGEIR